jgi:hypothetical protein|tara:strand:+ start:119 stop:544 length:426 start_codon:yes stop_codon:yes gene_type:complete
MDNLSEINVSNPDHACIIAKGNYVTFSIKKDGRTMDLKFPISTPIAGLIEAPDTTKQIHPKAPVKMLVSKITNDSKTGRRGNPKLTESDVREIKEILQNQGMMKEYGSKHKAYMDIAQGYSVSKDTIANIHANRAWRHVTV